MQMTVNPTAQSVVITPPDEPSRKARIVGENEEAESQKEMFLKLMIAQLKNQDPTAPMDQKDMMASITQFSQVEQMQNMTKAMETLSLAQGVNMIGKDVEYHYVLRNDAGETIVDEIRGGKVDHLTQKGGSVYLILENGVKLKPAEVTKVSES